MDHHDDNNRSASVSLETWLRAIVSGVIVMVGVVFLCVMLPFALRLPLHGFAFFWVILIVSLTVGFALGVLTVRQTIRREK